jgi:hypothetical protein
LLNSTIWYLPYGWAIPVKKNYNNYSAVEQEINDVKVSNAIPWFDKNGTGKQIQLPDSVGNFLNKGSLKVKP